MLMLMKKSSRPSPYSRLASLAVLGSAAVLLLLPSGAGAVTPVGVRTDPVIPVQEKMRENRYVASLVQKAVGRVSSALAELERYAEGRISSRASTGAEGPARSSLREKAALGQGAPMLPPARSDGSEAAGAGSVH